ncbi:hypothetical protein EGR_01144 [Echinococcus granulosus]|uniref:Uncharacterized protein n=1 Tax=Echinococcus granulosus TaxID=6210 RepID=W6UTP8_ECHGR|nr:hypothetical protein EGR_01144 [Echinococcus granulosus]EUB64016.1 hypothetical protein EGR_01144 [Echinococcus granulosus]
MVKSFIKALSNPSLALFLLFIHRFSVKVTIIYYFDFRFFQKEPLGIPEVSAIRRLLQLFPSSSISKPRDCQISDLQKQLTLLIGQFLVDKHTCAFSIINKLRKVNTPNLAFGQMNRKPSDFAFGDGSATTVFTRERYREVEWYKTLTYKSNHFFPSTGTHLINLPNQVTC